MISSIPTLTIDGFVTNKYIQMYKLFEYFLASDYSQSNTFSGKVASLKYILATETSETMTSTIENQLRNLYISYFDSVNVQTWTEVIGSKLHIYIDIMAEDNDKTYTLSKEVKSTKGEIENYERLLDELWEEYNKRENYEHR